MNRLRGATTVAMLGLFLVMSPSIWSMLEGWGGELKAQLWGQFEAALGRPVEYDRLAPSVLAAFEFRQVRIDAADGRPLLRAASIRLIPDWGAVWAGHFDRAISRVQIINAEVSLDGDRDRTLIDRWAALVHPTSVGSTPSLPPVRVEAFNLGLRWAQAGREWRVDRAFVTLSTGDAWVIDYRAGLSWKGWAAGWDGAATVKGDIRADASFDHLSGRLETSAVRTGQGTLAPLALQVGFSDRTLTVVKVADQIPLDLRLTWKPGTGSWAVTGSAERFRLGRLAQSDRLPGPSGLWQGTVTGEFAADPQGVHFDGAVEWPTGALPAPLDQSVRVSGRLDVTGPRVSWQGLRVDSPDLQLNSTGSWEMTTGLPDGRIEVDHWAVPGAGRARGAFEFHRQGDQATFAAEDLAWNDLQSSAVSGVLSHRAGLWAWQFQGPWDGAPGGRFEVQGHWDPSQTSGEAELNAEGLPVADLVKELTTRRAGIDLPADVATLQLGTSVRVRYDQGRWSVPRGDFTVTDPDHPRRHAGGQVVWDGARLAANLSDLGWDGFSTRADLAADFLPDGDVSWSFHTQVAAHALALSGLWDAQTRTLSFEGTPGIQVRARWGTGGDWAAQWNLSPLEVLPGWTFGMKGQGEGTGSRWTVDLDSWSLATVLGGLPVSLAGQFAADPSHVHLAHLTWKDPRGPLTGALDATWNPDFSQPWEGHLTLEAPSPQTDRVEADWHLTDLDNAVAHVQSTGVDLARLGLTPLTGKASVGLEGTLVSGQPTWRGQASLSEARWGEASLGLRLTASGDRRSAVIQDLNLALSPLRVVDGRATWATDGTWSLDAGIDLRLGAGAWTSRWVGSGQVRDDRTGDFLVKVSSNLFSQKKLADWSLLGRWHEGRWEAALGDGSVSASGTTEGAFQVRAQSPFPLQGLAQGTWSGTAVSVQVNPFRADLGPLKDVVNSPAFRLLNGEVVGAFSLEGNPADPDLTGNLLLKGVEATSSFVRQPLGPVDIPVVLEGHKLTIPSTNVGGSRTWLVSGLARLDHYAPEDYQFLVQTDTLSPIPAAYQGTGLSATGGATGLLVVRGTPLSVTLGGRLVLQDTTITLKESEPASGPPSPVGFNVDLQLVTGRKVEFLWPNESLPLLRAVASPNQNLSVKVNDVASTWAVTGKLLLKAGEINYLKRTFVVKEGNLTFNENQGGFDPRIAVRADWRYRDGNSNTTVHLRADGTLSRFQPRFDAEPYRSPEELQQLVGTTLGVPVEYTKTSADSALSVASDVGTSFLLSPFEEAVKRNFNLDLFTVKTEILKKSLLNRTGALEASDYLDNTRLFFGKYIGDDLFMQGTVSFRQDATAAALTPKMVVEPELQMEFQTPFFLLNWTLLPQHPETLFVTDNTVTFRWDWSY